jgi:hypothetical protein
MTAPNLPNWAYQIKQISVGIFVLHGVDKHGHTVDSVGTDSETLEEDFFEAAQKIDLAHFSEVKQPTKRKD